MTTYSSILQAAMKLSPGERSKLAETLLETVPDDEIAAEPELSEAWKQEIARRSADYDAGRVKTIPWSEVRDRVRQKYEDNA